MQFQRRKKARLDLNLLPMINVVFLLLIFFMVAGRVEKIDIFEVEPPISSTSRERTSYNSVVYLHQDGRIAVNDDVVEKDNLPTIIATLYIDNPTQEITVKSDAEVPAENLLYVMNVIESSGGQNVSLITQVKQ